MQTVYELHDYANERLVALFASKQDALTEMHKRIADGHTTLCVISHVLVPNSNP